MKDHITICICTLRRNILLKNLLSKCAKLETGELFEISIVVVDNDPDGIAQQTVMTAKSEFGIDITYGIEKVQTIPAARNHALRLARGNYIGIIDDDEFPPHNWLLTMYRAIDTFDSDGALGPVHPFFEQEPPVWLIKSKFCERPVHRTGTILKWDDTRTGNVLIKKDVFIKNNLFFDLNCKTSGSDKEFFREAMKLGCRFIAVEEAPVYEIVPPERQTKGYYLRRAMIQASNERKFRAPHLRGLSKVLAPTKAIIAVLIYFIMVPFCFLIGDHAVMKYGEKGIYHMSWLLTIFGVDLAKKRNL